MPRDQLADLPYASTLEPHRGDLAADEDYEGTHFDGLDFDAPQAPGSRFMECAFTQVTIQDGQLRQARFNDVWLRGVRLTATDLPGGERRLLALGRLHTDKGFDTLIRALPRVPDATLAFAGTRGAGCFSL